MLQQLQIQSGESFDYKQGYDFAIFEVHKQYNLRSRKNDEIPIKRSIRTQTKIIKQNPSKKVLQILPRGTLETLTPRIVDITPNETQIDLIIENKQDKKDQGKTVETKIEILTTEKQDKDTQTAHIKEYLNQINKPPLPFNI